MNRHSILLACILCLIALATPVGSVRAHEEITIGDYTVEVGWQNEPPIAWQENAIVLHIVHASDGQPIEDVSSLTLSIAYGGYEKELSLQPLEESGEFSAPVIPTVAGTYTIFLGGTLGDTPVDAHMEPEEVAFGSGERSNADESLQFPDTRVAPQASPQDGRNWLLYAGIAVGLLVLLFVPFQILRPRR